MVNHIKKASIIKAAGNKEKIIKEIIGRVNSNTSELSIAHMSSPEGWLEPGQKPEFDEYTYVLKGILSVETKDKRYELRAGEAILVGKAEWVRYSTPYEGGADYIAVCLPAFSTELVHREK